MKLILNQKFYQDVLNFDSQFDRGAALAKDIELAGSFNSVYLCGMGGSSLYADLINNINLYHFKNDTFVRPLRGYNVTTPVKQTALYIVSSHSGNTEEALTCLDSLIEAKAHIVIVAAGGQLLERAKQRSLPYIVIPSGTQPRLATGYFIGVVFSILANVGLVSREDVEELLSSTSGLNKLVNSDVVEKLANKIAGEDASLSSTKVPIIYGQEEFSGLARVAKIKFNENVKIQSFYNFFPEVNHNEMVGFTNMVMNPLFIFIRSNITNPRNNLRIDKFVEVLSLDQSKYEIIDMKGDNLITQIFSTYVFIDMVTVYLAEMLQIEAEPVNMVEDFKAMLG